MNISIDFKTGFINSKDGTNIGYRQIGSGPAVILVHGALQSSLNFTDLAKTLANDFTVFIPDRRGRGLTGIYGEGYGLSKEGEDLQALIHHSGAKSIFGLSSGAIVTLQAATMETGLQKVAIYEPPIPLDSTSSAKMDKDYEGALEKGNLGKAFVSIIKGTGDSSWLAILPGFITAFFINYLIKSQLKNPNPDEIPLEAIIPTFHYDRLVAKESANIIERTKKIKADMLLLGGSKSQKYLTLALEQLEEAMPAAEKTEFNGLGHLAAANGYSPEIVGAELKRFFKGDIYIKQLAQKDPGSRTQNHFIRSPK